jgi:hypothetical protein
MGASNVNKVPVARVRSLGGQHKRDKLPLPTESYLQHTGPQGVVAKLERRLNGVQSRNSHLGLGSGVSARDEGAFISPRVCASRRASHNNAENDALNAAGRPPAYPHGTLAYHNIARPPAWELAAPSADRGVRITPEASSTALDHWRSAHCRTVDGAGEMHRTPPPKPPRCVD